jgi:hypothetical protein
MSDYYDRDGRAIPMLRWAELHSSEYKLVAGDNVPLPDGTTAMVSTVWLGLDHGWGGELAIFETMVFGGSAYGLDGEQWRYATEAAAYAGHDQAIAWVRKQAATVTG